MRNLWIWVAVAAGLYGTLCLGGMAFPRPRDRADLKVQLPGTNQPAPGNREEQFRREGNEGWPELPPPMQGEAPLQLDFRQLPPGILTVPESPISVHRVPGAADALQWRLENPGRRIHVLSIPLGLEPGAKTLHLRVRAEPGAALHLGLRERSGAVYSIEYAAGPAWGDVNIALDALKTGRFQRDPDGRLDLDQVQALIIVVLHRPESNRPGEQPPLVELSNVRAE